eukprot:maker-scaffold68_size422247-snap-gene-3.24 protein:Tk11404 transcript:maker-scaffold68_size422247-snap-gene-3.24-mRNA-1 annotation:"hypothetical protein Phum_PHUM253780"
MTTTKDNDPASNSPTPPKSRSQSVPVRKRAPHHEPDSGNPSNDPDDACNELHCCLGPGRGDVFAIGLSRDRRKSADIVHELVLDRFLDGDESMMDPCPSRGTIPYGSPRGPNQLLRDSESQPPMCVKAMSASLLSRKAVSFQQDIPNCDTEANEAERGSADKHSSSNEGDMNSHGTVPTRGADPLRRGRQRTTASARRQKLPGISYLMEGEHCPSTYSPTSSTTSASPSESLPRSDPDAPLHEETKDDRSVDGSERNLRPSSADPNPPSPNLRIRGEDRVTQDTSQRPPRVVGMAERQPDSDPRHGHAKVPTLGLAGSLPDLQIVEDFEKDSLVGTRSKTLGRSRRECNADARQRWRMAFERIQLGMADGSFSPGEVLESVEGAPELIAPNGEPVSEEVKAKLANVKWKQVLRRLEDEKSFFKLKGSDATKHWREKSHHLGDRLREKSVAWRDKTLKAEHRWSDRAGEMFKEHTHHSAPEATKHQSEAPKEPTKHKSEAPKEATLDRSKTLKVRGRKAKEAIKQRSVSASRAFVEKSKEFSLHHTLRKPSEDPKSSPAKRKSSPFRFGSRDRREAAKEMPPAAKSAPVHDRGRSRKKAAVTQLREHWEDTSGKVTARKNQLEDLLVDNQQFEAKQREVEAWLSRMENWQARMRPVGHTPDVIEAQVREQKSFHAEVHQYKVHIEEFNHMTQDLISNYQHDDAAKIKKLTEHINQRYDQLNSSIVTRGKILHSGMTSYETVSPTFDLFLAWMGEMEVKLEQAGRDSQRSNRNLDPSHSKNFQ